MMEAITGNPTGPEITGSFHKKNRANVSSFFKYY